MINLKAKALQHFQYVLFGKENIYIKNRNEKDTVVGDYIYTVKTTFDFNLH